ncbi:sushi, von Willebrand factor type A, EGF and pentraxin domain-containing protein 1-like isoform X2 [Patiria miniata]|uniref:Uncharacterized protein n=1 Tax=Patiria miniata TaxID=46514 RepID=A0A913Z4W9_PATMI|nr:sushi, von Willebrand factor type A, EGF and pentraxin domain-containing protein 1-like isoform X2 [Patiria miniata]
MADNLCLGLLLFLCVLWPIISSASSNEACLYDEDVATATGRNCTTNRLCSIEYDICKGSRECLCDGACGYRCISTRKTSYCKELPPPLNGSVEYSTGNQAFGSRASYDCDTGYLLSSEGTEQTCQGDGEWSIGETPQCLPQDEVCPRLASVNRTCYQACNVRLDCENKRQESCLCDGDCGMSCRPVYVSGYCPEVELNQGAVVVSMTTKRIVYTSVVTLGCKDRFEVEEGSVEIRCLIDRTWSGQPLRCRRKAACEDPPEIEGVRHDSWEAYFYPGDELFYTCRPGYHGYGLGEKSSCREDLSWTPVSLDCYPISCGDPGYLSNGWREGNLFTFLSRVTFHCNAGYEMQGYPYRTCMSNQRWTSFLPTCVAIECPELYAPEHGSIQGRRFTYNSQVYLDCEDGYKLSGSEQRRCQGNKTWSGEETICRVITCPQPEAPLHGSKISPRYNLDAIVRFSCNQGYTLIGSRTARCTEEETWSQPTPECQADCIVLSTPEHGSYLRRYTANEVVEHGTVIEIVCSRWYSLNSDEEYTCTNGQWSFDAKCVATPCSKLPELLNGLIVYDPELVNQSLPTVPHETRATYTCLYGFELQGMHRKPQCYYGTWYYKTSEPVCSPKLCSQDNLEHGSVRYTKNNEEFNVRDQDPHHGVSRTFKCSRGYSLVSAKTEASVCVDGVWNTTLPACGPDSCSRPAVAASNVEVQSLGHGGTARVTCDQGLKPSVGNGGLHCHAGHWVPEGIMCISSDASSNVAYGRPASQSPRSDESNRQQASLAVDGDRTTDSEHGSCTTAGKSGRQVFWEVDLQATYRIEYVDIYSKRKPKLIGATVQVGYPDAARESYSQCGLTISSQMARGRQPRVRVDCNRELIAGQIIRIELQESDKLSLCEVEVFATGPIATCRIPHIAGMRQTLEGDGGVPLTNAQVPPGTGIAYNCETGYQHNGAVDNLCRGDGTWARQLPTCDAADCEVSDPFNGELDQRIRSIRHNSELAYSCNDGYEKENKVTRCELGELTPGPPKCVHQRCPFWALGLSNVMINNQELEPDAEGKVYIPHETAVYFSCKRGFELVNNNGNTPRCLMGELLDYTHVPACYAVRCRDPYLMHGSFRLIQGDRYEHGSTIRYECNPGYTLQDPAAEYSHCDDGTWSREIPPVCQSDEVPDAPVAAATCPTPSVPSALIYHRGQNIATAGFEIIFGNRDEIEVRCNTDFTVSGREAVTTTCWNGAWTPALPRCAVTYKRSCSRPGKITNVRQYGDDSIKLLDTPRTSFFHESTIMSRCQDPLKMKLVTGPLRTCNDGRWTGPVPVCLRALTSFSLPALDTTLHQFMANGTLLIYPGVGQLNVDCIVSSGYPVLEQSHSQERVPGGRGQKKYGVPAEGHSGTYICKKFGSPTAFHRLMIQVRAVSCSEPSPPLNSRRIGDDFRLTKSVSFKCNEGYDLIGERTIKCNLGKWLGEKPRCRARDCPEINMAHLDPNLRLTINGGNSPGSVVIFTCQSGFHRVGETRLTCQGGSWSLPFPTCEADVPDDTGPLLGPDDCNCEVWERCVANRNGPSTCHCIHPRQCDDVGQEQYCGSDGRTYTSICRMKAAGCLLDLDIQVVSNGPCPETTGDPNQPEEDTLYSDYASESSELSMDSALSPIPADGKDMPTAADRSVEGTTQGSSTSIQYCETCVALNLGTACQNSTHVFVGIPQKVEPAQPDSLNYSVNVVTTIKGYTHTQDITFLMQGTLDETNQCYCPRVTVGHDEYLFILRENSSASFPITNGFVGLWADHSATYNSTCNL